jgi:hypothetical protein
VTDYSTELIDLSSGSPESANVLLSLSPEAVLAVEAIWGPARIESLMKMLQAGVSLDDLPEHSHWNWSNKLRGYSEADHRFVGVECRGEIQGLMRLDLNSELARLEPDEGKPLVYVSFLESAPWNTKQFTKTPRYKLTGLRLIQAAVRYSQELGFDGRVGLHGLQQAGGFYEARCRMVACGPDPDHERLMYYELSRENAELLRGEL